MMVILNLAHRRRWGNAQMKSAERGGKGLPKFWPEEGRLREFGTDRGGAEFWKIIWCDLWMAPCPDCPQPRYARLRPRKKRNLPLCCCSKVVEVIKRNEKHFTVYVAEADMLRLQGWAKKCGPQVARIFQSSWGRRSKQQQDQNSPNLGMAI